MKKPSYAVSAFGRTKYGEKARKFTLNGAGGVVMEVSDYGGKIVKIFTPDRNGKMKDVVVGLTRPRAGTTAIPTGVASSAATATASRRASSS